jgi:regulator of protease activity HflC (stomatin/prohibitin superfamily)
MSATLRRLLLGFALAALPLSGCTCHHTGTNEVGVLTRKIGLWGKAGIQPEAYGAGATYFFPALITDWHTFDRSLQNLVMVRSGANSDRNGEDDIFFKTLDGNDIRVDVTVVWQIDETRVGYLLERVGASTEEVKEQLVRPICRSVVRDVLNELNSEDFYVSDKRFAKAQQAQDKLNAILNPQGVIVSQVIVGEYHFNDRYQEVIHDKKLAEQKTAGLRSQAKAAAEQSKRNLEQAKGQVAQQVAQARGALDTIKLQADAQLFQNQQRAKAIVIERKAEAEATKKQNEALASSGGKTMVKLRIAEALQGKQLLFVPSGKGGANLQKLDINQLLASMAAQESLAPAPTAQATDTSGGP